MRFNPRAAILSVASGSICLCLISCSQKKDVQQEPILRPYTGSTVASNNSQMSPAAISAVGEPGKPQSVDIISGKPVNRGVLSDYNGQRVYFCCATSKGAFDANPQAYIEAIRKQGIILDPVK
jgi:YHS domain-containing protein